MLGLNIGWYQHNVGSFHVYQKDIEKVEKSLAADIGYVVLTTKYSKLNHNEFISELVEFESVYRFHPLLDNKIAELEDKLGKDTYWLMLVLLSALQRTNILSWPEEDQALYFSMLPIPMIESAHVWLKDHYVDKDSPINS